MATFGWRSRPANGRRCPAPASASSTPRRDGSASRLSYPDPARNGRGFNPTFYPDLELGYRVSVDPLDGDAFRITRRPRPAAAARMGRPRRLQLRAVPGPSVRQGLADGRRGRDLPAPGQRAPGRVSPPTPGPPPRNLQAYGPVPLSDEPLDRAARDRPQSWSSRPTTKACGCASRAAPARSP